MQDGSVEHLIVDGVLAPPADKETVTALSASLGPMLPDDYFAFLRRHNGGEGFVGDNYIILWKAEELADLNREYQVELYAPGILLFGSNGGGEGFGFDLQAKPISIVRLPFIGMDREHAIPIASSFSDFIRILAEQL